MADDDEPIIALCKFTKDGEELLGLGRTKWLSIDDDGSVLCRCPPQEPTFEQLKSLLLKKVDPGEDWINYPCEVIKTYRDFLSAHLGLKHRLEIGSDYVTETELGIGCRRKIKTTKVLSNEEEETVDEPNACQASSKKIRPSLDIPSFKFLPSSRSNVPKSMVQVTSKSVRETNNKKTVHVSRKNRGTAATSIESFKKTLQEKKAKVSFDNNKSKKFVEEKSQELLSGMSEDETETGVVKKLSNTGKNKLEDQFKKFETGKLKKQGEDENLKKKVEDIMLKRKAEDAKLKRKAEDDILKKKAEEAQLKRKAEDDSLKKKAEDAKLKRKAEDDILKKKVEDAKLKRKAEDDMLRKKAEDAKVRKKVEDDVLNKIAQDANLKKKAEEDMMKKKAEDANLKKKAEEDMMKKKAEYEELKEQIEYENLLKEQIEKEDEELRKTREELKRNTDLNIENNFDSDHDFDGSCFDDHEDDSGHGEDTEGSKQNEFIETFRHNDASDDSSDSESVTEISKTVSTVSHSSDGATFTVFERQVLSYLKEINSKVENVLMNQSKLNLHLLPGERVLSRPEGMPTIPVKNIKDLKKLEKYLSNSENVTNLSIYLSTHVSKNEAEEYKSTLSLLRQLMDNSVAKLYSFCGKKGKESFTKLNVWTAVKGAILCKIAETNLAETKRATMSWLRDAPYRTQGDGSTSKRQERSS